MSPGESACIAHAFDVNRQPLTHFVHRMTESLFEAQDVTQDVFLRFILEVRAGNVVLELDRPCRGDPESAVDPTGADPTGADPTGADPTPDGSEFSPYCIVHQHPRSGSSEKIELCTRYLIRSWLYHAAVNKTYDLQRSRKRESIAVSQLELQASSGGPERVFRRQQNRERVFTTLKRMNERESFPLWTHACGFTYEEIAGFMGINPNTIGYLIPLARASFRKYYLADLRFAQR